MNTREILKTWGPIMSYLSDQKLFDFMSNKVYCQIGHGVSHEYWRKAYGHKGYINAANIRQHIEDAINETGPYSDAAMAAGLRRYLVRKAEERRIANFKL